MTSKDYNKLAEIFASTFPSHSEEFEAYSVWHEIRGQLMEMLQADNPRFDRQKFIEASEEVKI